MDDLISRQAAISAICNACGKIDCDKMDKCEKLQLPPANCSEFPNNSDTISRQAAIDAIKGLPTWWADEGGYYGGAQPPMEALLDPEDAVSAIENLPSAQPERKRGEWVYNSPVTMKCNRCGLVIKDWDWHRFKICPNCGADMRGEQDG